jgi:cellulose biosynthesis protein BcsQ
MAKKIFIGNYKGGVGKTTTVFEIGVGLAKSVSWYKKYV